MKAIRLAGRIAALALMGAGLVVGWFGIAEMTMEKPSVVFWKMILPGVALILAGVWLEAAWRMRRR
jgi:hypothetical protein